jgi:hypothetical protein
MLVALIKSVEVYKHPHHQYNALYINIYSIVDLMKLILLLYILVLLSTKMTTSQSSPIGQRVRGPVPAYVESVRVLGF